MKTTTLLKEKIQAILHTLLSWVGQRQLHTLSTFRQQTKFAYPHAHPLNIKTKQPALRGMALLLLAFLGLGLGEVMAQSEGDYRSRQTGNWNQTGTWERFDGTTWVAASATPTSSDGLISILNGHTVTVTASVTVDQVVIEAGGQVTLSGGTLTVSNGPGDDFIILGTYRRTSSSTTISINSGAVVRCANGGIYEHALAGSGGSVPTITWEDESIFRLLNSQTTATAVTGLNQSFGIVEINRPGQTTTNEDITIGDVRNELRVISTGSGRSRWNSAFSISGSYVQTGGAITVRTNTGSSNFDIGGNFSLEGGTFRITDANGTANAVTLNVDGNFTMSGGTFIFCATGTTSGPAFASIKGNVTISGGSLAGGFLRDASGFYFNGQSSEQTLTFGLSLSSGVLDRFYYRSGAGGPTGLNEIYNGTSAQNTVTGTGANPGAGWTAWPTSGSLIKNLTIDNPAGVTLSTAKEVNTTLFRTSGSLSGTPNVTYASGATLHYNGTAAITTADKEFPSSSGPTNFVVSNPGGVTLHANRTLSGNLTVNNSGALNLGAFTLNRGSSGGTLTLGEGTTLQIGGSNGFPTNYANNTINATSTVVYNGTTQTAAGTGQGVVYGNLELSGSGTKTFASTPDVAGNFVIGGTASVTPPADFRFSGASAQSIAGLAYNNIEFYGAGAKTFTSNASVGPTSAITFSGTPGTVDFDGVSNNLEFVLQSTSAGTARIGNATGWTLNGQVRAERFVPNRRAWRLMASAVNPSSSDNTIWHQWQNSGTANGATGINIFGPNANLPINGLHPANASSIFEYPTTLPASNWTVVSNTQNAALSMGGFGKGYLLFITNPFTETPVNISGQGSAATTLRPNGTLRVGDINVPTSEHPLHTLVGNPYASPIDVANMVSTNAANFGTKIWVFDPALIPNGGYAVYDSGAGGYTPSTSFSNSPSTPIQSGQAFFVRQKSDAIPSQPEFQIRETHKATLSTNVFGRMQIFTESEAPVEQIRLSLFRNVENEWRMADGAVAAFSPNHSNALDNDDVTKMAKGGENLAFRRTSTNLTIEFRNTAVALDTLIVRVSGVANGGEYRLRLHSQDFTNTAVQAYLWDTFTETLTEIPLNGNAVDYLFQTSSAFPASAGDRFRIVFHDAPLSVGTPQVSKIHAYPNPVQEGYVYIDFGNISYGNYQVQVIDVLGKTLISNSLLNNGERQRLELSSLPLGMYVIQVSNGQEKYSTKLIVE